jgi:DNA polymerase I
VSGDRDLLQLVTEEVQVWFVGGRGQTPTLYDLAKVRERFGLAPPALPSYVALVGDASDNLPGVPGVGPRTASRLIGEYGDVGALLAGLDGVKPEKLREALRASAEQLRLNEELARLRGDVPLPDGPRAASLDAEALGRLRALFEELEFKSLLPRVYGLAAPP